MADIPYQLVSIVIWPSCVLLTYLASRWSAVETRTDNLIIAVCVGLLAMLFTPSLGLTGSLSITIILIVVSVVFLFFIGVRSIARGPIVNFGLVALLMLAVSYLVFLIYLIGLIPISGWDVLDYWGNNAARFLEYSAAGAVDPYSGLTSYTHPHTIINLNAASTYLKFGERPYFYIHGIPWLYSYITIAALIFSVGYRQLKNVYKAAVLAIVGCGTPLLEQHIISPGYAEIHLSACVLAATVLFLRLCEGRNLIFLVLFTLFIVAVALIKNSGIIFSAIISLSAGIYILNSQSKLARKEIPIKILLLLMIFLVCAAIFYQLEGSITFGSRVLVFSSYSPDIPAYFVAKYFKNMSFSVLGISTILGIISLSFCGRGSKAVFVAFVILGVESMLTLSLATEYGRSIAGPGFDIGNSRLTLPAVVLVPIFLTLIIQELADGHHKDSVPRYGSAK